MLVRCPAGECLRLGRAQLEAGTGGSGNLPVRDLLNQARRFIPLRLENSMRLAGRPDSPQCTTFELTKERNHDH